jgi:hypothetical protein
MQGVCLKRQTRYTGTCMAERTCFPCRGVGGLHAGASFFFPVRPSRLCMKPAPVPRPCAWEGWRCGSGAMPPRRSGLEGDTSSAESGRGRKAPPCRGRPSSNTKPRPAVAATGVHVLRRSRRPTTRGGRLQVGCRQVFWLPGHPPAAPSHRRNTRRQWRLQRSSPVTAARPRPIRTAFPLASALRRKPATIALYFPRARSQTENPRTAGRRGEAICGLVLSAHFQRADAPVRHDLSSLAKIGC